jgi:OOP family OmpA-OmpF porin
MSKKMQRRLRELNKDADKTTRAARKKGSAPVPFEPKDEEVLVETVGFVIAVLIGFVVLLGLGVFFGLRNVEETIEATTERALRSEGMPDVAVEASGNEVLLVGTVAEEDQVAYAQEVAAGVEGVAEVSANVVWVPPNDSVESTVVAEPFDVTWLGGAAAVSGTLSEQARVDQVVAVLDGAFASVDAAGLVVREGLPPEDDWLASILRVVEEVSGEVSEGTVVVNPNDRIIVVGAEFETRQERREVKDEVESLIVAVPFVFSSGLTVKDAPLVTREQVEELQTNLDELIEGKVVEFEFNSAVLTEEGRELLDEIVAALKQVPLVPVEIAGHTDDIGSPESNLVLSRERAEAVLAYLTAAGEDPKRFVVIGYGESQPIADNATEEGRARNRRIQFVALLEES